MTRTGTMVPPVSWPSLMIPGCISYFGPRGPSGVMPTSRPSFTFSAIMIRALSPLSGLELEPRAASNPNVAQTSAMIWPSPLGLLRIAPGMWANHWSWM